MNADTSMCVMQGCNKLTLNQNMLSCGWHTCTRCYTNVAVCRVEDNRYGGGPNERWCRVCMDASDAPGEPLGILRKA